MTGRLARYIGRLFLTRTIGAVLVFAALMQVLDLLDAATEVMERGKGVWGIAYYALLRLPVTGAVLFAIHTYVVRLDSLTGAERAGLDSARL